MQQKIHTGTQVCNQVFLLLAEDDSSEFEHEAEVLCEQEQHSTDPPNTYFQLSPQALTDQFSPQTLKFQCIINGI